MSPAPITPAFLPVPAAPPLSGDQLAALSVADRRKALEHQSNFAPASKPGESPVIRHKSVGFDEPLPERPDPLTKTVYDLFAHGVRYELCAKSE